MRLIIVTLFSVNTGYDKTALTYGGFDDDGMGNVGITTMGIIYGYPPKSSRFAITELVIEADAGDLADTSTFDLFGILPHMAGASFS